MPLGDNPNIFVTPNISPPFPVWEQTRNYWLGDVVNYAGQNWFLLFYANNATQVGPGYAPDLYPITLNGTPESSPGIYVPVANPPIPANLNGGCWVNLTLATPPATPWSPTVQYNPGDVVMYPVESPGSYWRCVVASLGDDTDFITGTKPQLPFYVSGSAPPRISPQFWEPLSGSSVPSQPPAAGLKAGDYAQPLAPLASFGAVNPDGTPVTLEFYWTNTPGFSYSSFELQLVNNTDPTDVYALVTLPGDTFSYIYSGVPPEENFTATITPKLFLQTATPSTISVTTGDTTINGPSSVTANYDNVTLDVAVGWASVLNAVDYDIFISATNPVLAEQLLAGNVSTPYFDGTSIYAEAGLGAIVTVSVAANFVSGPQSAKTAATPFTIIPVPATFVVTLPLHGATSFSGLLTFSQPSPTNGATFTGYFEVVDVTGGGSLVVGNTSASPFSVSNPSTNVPITESLTSPNTFISDNTYIVVVYITSSVTALESTSPSSPFTIAVIPS